MSEPLRKSHKDHGASAATAVVLPFNDEKSLIFYATPSNEPPHRVDLTEFANGPRPKHGKIRKGLFGGRPNLISEMMRFLRAKFSSLSKTTVARYKHALRAFWRFLDTLPPSAMPEFLSDIDELTGSLWIKAGVHCEDYARGRSLLEGARQAAGLARLFWPDAPRPDPRHGNPVCQMGMRRLYHALKAEASEILKHRALGRALAREGRDPGVVGSAAWQVLENQAWVLQRNLPLSGRRPLDRKAIGACSPVRRRPLAGGLQDTNPMFNKMTWFHPSKTQVSVFHLLFTMQAGWNQETVDNIDVSSDGTWFSVHPRDPELAVIKSIKFKPTARQQIALSKRKPGFHMFRIIETMIEMTEPLRAEVRQLIVDAETRLAADPANMDLSREVAVLHEKARSPWLYFGCSGRASISTPTPEQLNPILQLVIKKHCVCDEAGCLLDITVGDLRDAWIGYAYQKSGYSWLIAQLAAGHARASTVRHYLRQRQWRIHGEKQVRKLQDAMWIEIRARRVLDGAVLRLMVQRGEISEEQRARWETHKGRTRMGMGCRNPRQPPASIAPGHVEGEVCRVQRCVLCHQGVLFSDSLDGLARRNAELIHVRETTPLPSWLQSTWSDELEVLEEHLKDFAPKDVEARTAYWLAGIRAGTTFVFDHEGTY